jgi:chorismate mutase
MKIADKIGEYKKAKNIAILQSSRWRDILDSAVAQGQTKGLSKNFVETLYKAIHQESINHQEAVMRGSEVEKG